jgi:hypothetical protein
MLFTETVTVSDSYGSHTVVANCIFFFKCWSRWYVSLPVHLNGGFGYKPLSLCDSYLSHFSPYVMRAQSCIVPFAQHTARSWWKEGDVSCWIWNWAGTFRHPFMWGFAFWKVRRIRPLVLLVSVALGWCSCPAFASPCDILCSLNQSIFNSRYLKPFSPSQRTRRLHYKVRSVNLCLFSKSHGQIAGSSVVPADGTYSNLVFKRVIVPVWNILQAVAWTWNWSAVSCAKWDQHLCVEVHFTAEWNGRVRVAPVA